ncbi:MAG: cellulase family glycosylhydrolase [Chitinophagales bacterium]|nr:cellulase family glycosylhydrolase [Chitinophagales bacterium]
MLKKYQLFVFGCMLIFASCKKDENKRGDVSNNTQKYIYDQYGRTLILHGLNTSSSAKGEPERQPWITEADVQREHEAFGFNFVRYLIFWDAIEPQRDVFDDAYLDKVQTRVEWYTSRGMQVMLDMHQDVYSSVFGADGAPAWAVETNGHPINTDGTGPWWLKNADPAVIAAWTNFWKYGEHKHLQDHYILAWKKVMERFKDNPNVIGYDLMNEPWGGDLVKVFITGDFERKWLAEFYGRMIPALRAVEPNKYLFFEPTPAPVTFGAPSNLPAVTDTRDEVHLVYAPHCYPYDTHEGLGYTAASQKNLKDWEAQRRIDTKKHGDIPLLCGEFGLSPTQEGFDSYLKDVMAVFDRNLWHWAYWSNDLGGWSPLNADGTETAILPYLLRTYPKAVAGIIEQFSYDHDSKVFSLTFISDANITQPTEIFIPKRYYPSGHSIKVSGTTDYTTSYDETSQVLKLTVRENRKVVTVEIWR